jgi:hypothetical protein
MRPHLSWIAALLLLMYSSSACLGASGANLPGTCSPAVPQIWEVDQTPTPPAQYGKCTDAIEPRFHKESNW